MPSGPPLPDVLRDLLEEERAITNVAPDAARRDVRLRVERELGIDLDLATTNEPSRRLDAKRSAGPRVGARFRGVHLVAASVLSFAAGIGVGAGMMGRASELKPSGLLPAFSAAAAESSARNAEPAPSATSATSSAAPAASGSSAPRIPTAEPASAAHASAAPVTESLAATRGTATRGSAGAEGSGSRERTLLDRARMAMARGDVTAASSALDEHEQNYPAGALSEERDFLRIQESLRSRKRDEAVARASAFRAKHPSSVLGPAIDRLLAAPNP